jgi:Ion channel.
MQRTRYRERGQCINWGANQLFRAVFKHGKSFARLFIAAAVIILALAGTYCQANLVIDNPDALQSEREFISNPLDAVYFSTLRFTTLGLGEFQPSAASQLGRGLVLLQAVLGAILIAMFVFVLGRRAAR